LPGKLALKVFRKVCKKELNIVGIIIYIDRFPSFICYLNFKLDDIFIIYFSGSLLQMSVLVAGTMLLTVRNWESWSDIP
jgi:hypothetical protein